MLCTIVLSGDADFAPVCMLAGGNVPSWSGKIGFMLTTEETETIIKFCMNTAYELGFDDFIENRPLMENPFHPQFLYGIPFATFDVYYGRGSRHAAGSWSFPPVRNFPVHAQAARH